MTQERKYSTPRLLSSLEEVAKTRTPIWDISGSGDIRIKLDTDVNDQEWYVIEDDSKRCGAFSGEVPCWAFPHWNGGNDFYRYVPVAFCFKTFASLLEEYPQHTKYEEWSYDEEEHTERLERANWRHEQTGSLEGKTLAELKAFAEAGRVLASETGYTNPFGHFVRRFQDGTYSLTGRFPQQGESVPKILISGGIATYEDLINEAKDGFLNGFDLPVWFVMSEDVKYCAKCGVPVEKLACCQWCGEHEAINNLLGDIEIDL